MHLYDEIERTFADGNLEYWWIFEQYPEKIHFYKRFHSFSTKRKRNMLNLKPKSYLDYVR